MAGWPAASSRWASVLTTSFRLRAASMRVSQPPLAPSQARLDQLLDGVTEEVEAELCRLVSRSAAIFSHACLVSAGPTRRIG